MCRANSTRNNEDYEVIRKYKGEISCEEVIRRIIERHRNKSIQVAYEGENHERV